MDRKKQYDEEDPDELDRSDEDLIDMKIEEAEQKMTDARVQQGGSIADSLYNVHEASDIISLFNDYVIKKELLQEFQEFPDLVHPELVKLPSVTWLERVECLSLSKLIEDGTEK